MPLKKLHLLFTKECITMVELIIFLERLNNTDEDFNLNFQLYVCTKQNEETERCFISSTVKKFSYSIEECSTKTLCCFKYNVF